jgi:hypothetical protein
MIMKMNGNVAEIKVMYPIDFGPPRTAKKQIIQVKVAQAKRDPANIGSSLSTVNGMQLSLPNTLVTSM